MPPARTESDIRLEPADNERLASLCGPLDRHLRQLEHRLGVEITLPYPPLLSVTHVKTYDDNDVATTWAASNYFVDTTSIPGRIVARDGVSLPVATRVANGFEIEFVAGYGDDEADVPETVRTGILIMAAHLHEHRGDDDPAKAAQASGATSYWRAEKVFVA